MTWRTSTGDRIVAGRHPFDRPVSQRFQSWVGRVPVPGLVVGQVDAPELRVCQRGSLLPCPLWYHPGRECGEKNPSVSFDLHALLAHAHLPQGAEHLCDLRWQYELVTSEEAGELPAPMLKLANLLLKRLVDPGNRSAELIRVSIEEVADLSERDTCIGKDLDPHEIDDRLCAIAAVTGVIPHGFREQTDPVVMTDRPHGDAAVAGQLADRQELRHQDATGESRLYNFTAHRNPATAMPAHQATATMS